MFSGIKQIELLEKLKHELSITNDPIFKYKLVNDITLLEDFIREELGKKDNEYVSTSIKKRSKVNQESLNGIACVEMMRKVNYLRPRDTFFTRYSSLKESDTIKLSKDFMSNYVSSSFLNDQIEIKFIKKSSVLGLCCYLITEGKHLILIRNTHKCDMFPTLVHELGHTIQTHGIKDINEYTNILGSQLSEVTSCFYELLAYDKLDGVDKTKCRFRILNLVNCLSNDDYVDIGINYTDLHSRLVAMYLYDMYQTNPSMAIEIVQTIEELMKKEIDRNILNKVHINEDNMSNGYQKYLSLYNREK